QPQTGQIHVLLLRARPPRGWHGGHADGQIAARGRAGGSLSLVPLGSSPRRSPVVAARRPGCAGTIGAPDASCSREASQKNQQTATTMITMSSVIISPPAVRWSA